MTRCSLFSFATERACGFLLNRPRKRAANRWRRIRTRGIFYQSELFRTRINLASYRRRRLKGIEQKTREPVQRQRPRIHGEIPTPEVPRIRLPAQLVGAFPCFFIMLGARHAISARTFPWTQREVWHRRRRRNIAPASLRNPFANLSGYPYGKSR